MVEKKPVCIVYEKLTSLKSLPYIWEFSKKKWDKSAALLTTEVVIVKLESSENC